MTITKEYLENLEKTLSLIPLSYDRVFKSVFKINLDILKEFLKVSIPININDNDSINLLDSEIPVTSKNEYNNYSEKAKVNYNVELKQNDFYPEDYDFENNTLIATLINNFDIYFNYNLTLDKEQEYTYSYKILAKTMVQNEADNTSIYETTEELVNKEEQTSNSKNLNIIENLKINYDTYNDKINKFVNLYGLTDSNSMLELEMKVKVINKYDGTQINKEENVMTLTIPLTTKTVDISVGQNVVQDEGKILSKKSEYSEENLKYLLIIGIVAGIAGILVLIKFIKYLFETRSAETMYDQQLKMILFNYKNYIQQTNNKINEKDYKVIQINTFNEMIGLRDTIQSPILMYTVENERKTYFMIIKDGLLYTYLLGSNEIREELRKNAAQKKKK